MEPGTPAPPIQEQPLPAADAPPPTRSNALIWVVTVVLLIAAAAGAYFAYRAYARERDASTAVARASTLLERAEADLLIVDDAVQVEIASVAATQSLEAAALARDVGSKATEASEIIAAAMDDLAEDQVPLAEALKESADARAEMMEIAPGILEADAKAAEAIGYADQALAEIKGAEDLSAQAAAEFNRHTADGVRASDALSVQAEGKLSAAASLLTSATASFPGADFTPFRSYIDAKMGLIALAKEIDALWLAGDIAGSNTKLASYNQRDAEIVAMAQALPASIRDPIANAYEAVTADALTSYFAARERARVAGDRVSEIRKTAVQEND